MTLVRHHHSRTLRRAGTAFAVSLALHGGLLAGLVWLFGSAGPSTPAASLIAVTLAAAPSGPSATTRATEAQPIASPAPVPPQRASAPPAPAAARSKSAAVAVVSTEIPAETEAERRLREALAALAAGTIDPPAHSGALAQASQPTASDTPAAPPAGADASTRGFVELHVLDWLAQHRRYPRAARRAGIEGTVHVRFVIDPIGRIDAAQVERSSGAGILDRAALTLLQSASPVPGLAQFGLSQRLELRLPIDYRLRRVARAG